MFSNLHFPTIEALQNFWLFRTFGYGRDRNYRINPKSAAQTPITRPAPDEAPAIPAARPPRSREPRLLKALLGRHFDDLHPDIAARFAHGAREESLHFTGTMDVVRRSAAGWILAQLTRFSGLLPTCHGRNVPFEFHIRPSGMSWLKHRCYHFAHGDFDFRSTMQPDTSGRLVERFRGGLGMFLVLRAEGDTLHFADRGYFLHWRRFMLPLPAWLHPGRFTLVHRNLDARRFSVLLTLRHPILGLMIEQSGTFAGEARLETRKK